MPDRMQLARDVYGADESGDRRVVEELLTHDFTFLRADASLTRRRPCAHTTSQPRRA
jgi:hypothetical protein